MEDGLKKALVFHRDNYYSSLELKHQHTRQSYKLAHILQCYSLMSPSLFPSPKTSQAASGNETIPVWDRWKSRLIGSLKASSILEDAWVKRFTSETPCMNLHTSYTRTQNHMQGYQHKLIQFNSKLHQFRCIYLIRPKITLHETHETLNSWDKWIG